MRERRREREEKKGGGWNFGRSVAGRKMRKEGLGAVGLLQDVVSGRQEYRKTERQTHFFLQETFRCLICTKLRDISSNDE